MKRTLLVLVVLALASPGAAYADGAPIVGVDGAAGVVSSDGQHRIVTFAGIHETIVASLQTHGAAVARQRRLTGSFLIPAVASDGSTTGLSADGRTLVLIQQRRGLPQKRTRLVMLDPQRRFAIKRGLVLKGDFSLDAMSPDGSRLFLIQYLKLSPHNFDPTQYAVRSLDTRTGKLEPSPIVDPREPDENMGGLPVTRATSADGRWAYTLYFSSKHPFVHALDTVGRTARCIDVDALTGREDLFQMRLRLRGGSLQITKDDKPVMLVNTRTFAVSRPASPAPARVTAPSADDGQSLWPYVVVAAGLLLLIAASARPLARSVRAR